MALTFPLWALVKREFVSLVRANRSYVILTLAMGACIVGVAIEWPQQEQYVSLRIGELSRSFMYNISLLLLAGCAMFMPALGATCIVVEREQETLDMLRTTLIRPSGIILGKLLNTVGFFLVLFVAALPVLSTVFFLVGLDWVQLAQALAVVLSTTFSCAMMGIWCSARFRKTFVAIGAAYGGVLGVVFSGIVAAMIAVPVLALVAFDLPYSIRPNDLPLCPFRTVRSIFDQTLVWGELSGTVLVQMLLCAGCFVWTLRILRRPPAPPKIEAFRPIDDPKILWKRRTTWPFYLIDPRARKKPIEDGRNPMLLRELRWGIMTRETFLARLFLASFGLWFLSSFPAVVDIDVSGVPTWFVTMMVITILLAPAFLANTLTKEYEIGNIDMLRMTLLTPREIILGKLAAGVTVVAPMYASAVVASVALFVTGTYTWSLLFKGYVSLLLCAALSVCIGLFSSVLTKRSSTALVFSYLFTLALFAGSLIVGILFWDDVNPHSATPEVHAFVAMGSPIVAFMWSLDQPRSVAHFPFAWCVNLVMYCALCLALVRASINLFQQRRLRDV